MINIHTQSKKHINQNLETASSPINSNNTLNNEAEKSVSIYKQIAEESDDLISIATFDLRPKFIYTNPVHSKKLGFKPNELVGKSCFDYIHPDDKKKLLGILKSYVINKVKKFATGIEEELKENFEFRILDNTNNWHYVNATAKLLKDKKILIISQDITKREKNENEGANLKDNISFLTHSGMDLLHISSVESIYDYVAKKIHELINHSGYIVIVEYDHSKNTWSSKSQEGLSPFIQNLTHIFGFDIRQIKGPIVKQQMDTLYDGKLIQQNPNLTLVTKSLINEKARALAFKALKVENIYSIAFKNEQNVYGSMSIISTNKTPAINSNLIEAFIMQASAFIERRKSQKSLSQSEIKYKLLIENQTDLIVKVDSNGIFLFASPSYCEMFGKSQSELVGSSFIPFIHKSDKKNTIYEMEKLYKPPYACYVEQRAMTIHGWRWLAWSDKAILNDKNEVKEIIAVGRDITEQKLAEKILKDSEEKYRTLFENSSDPTLIIENNRFIQCNEATVKFLGYNNKSEIIGKTPIELSPKLQPDGQLSSKLVMQKINEAKQNGTTRFEWVHNDKNNTELWVNVSLTYLPNNNRIYTIWREINEAKKAEQALKSSEEKYRSVVNHSQEGIFVVQGWHFAYTNPSLSKLLDYTRNELLIMEFINVVHEDDREKITENNRRRLLGEDIPPYEFRIIKKSKEVLWVSLNATKIDWNDRPAALCFISDITERKKSELELEKYQEKLEELVMERTRELEEKNKELKKFNKLFIGREFKIKELKDRIKMLES